MDISVSRTFRVHLVLILVFTKNLLSLLCHWIDGRRPFLLPISEMFWLSRVEHINIIWIWAWSTFWLTLLHISHIGLTLTHYHVFCTFPVDAALQIFFRILESIIYIATLTKQIWIEKIRKYWVIDHAILLLKIKLKLLLETALVSLANLTHWIELARRVHLLDDVSNHHLIVLALLERGLSVDAVEVVFKIQTVDELKAILLGLAKAVQRRIPLSHFVLMLFAKALLQNQSILQIELLKEAALIILRDLLLFKFLVQCEDLSGQHGLLFGLVLVYGHFLNQFDFLEVLFDLVHYWWFMVNLDVDRLFWEYWCLLLIFIGRIKSQWLSCLILVFLTRLS